ncbi:MAG: glycosyltransferase [Sphingobacteriaceae bacterium]|nr:glycosyltransferase [Sphingobacteriaceae bacterium]
MRVLCICGIHASAKNIATLIKAFGEFKKEKTTKIKLVFAGPAAWGMSDTYELIKKSGVEGEVLFTNRLSNEDMALVLGSAMALTFIPYYEGFGIPLVEAMAAEVPIITSNVTSLPEIAGDAALLVDPLQVSEVKNAMVKIFQDEALRNSLVEKGKLQGRIQLGEEWRFVVEDSIQN